MTLFSEERKFEKIKLALPDADITYYPHFFTAEEASHLYSKLETSIDWQHDDITIFGKTYKQPRLTALYGNSDKTYSYSGIKMFPKQFTPTLLSIKEKVESLANHQFNSVLLNYYRDGQDSNGWHSDDEKGLGTNPFIASLTFGAKRTFHLRLKRNKKIKHSIVLEHGSLLLMGGSTQHFWQHQLPKSKRITEARINLTFRFLI